MKLRPKILILVLGILIVSFLALSLPLYWYTRSALEDELDKRLLSVAEIASKNLNKDLLRVLLKEPSLFTVRASLTENLSHFSADEIEGIAVLSPGGNLLANTGIREPGGDQISLIRQLLSDVGDNQRNAVSEIYQLSGEKYFKAAATFINVEQDLSAVLVVWAGAEFMATIDQIIGSIFWIILISIVVAVSLAIVFSQSLIAPVKRLAGYAQSIQKNIYTEPVNIDRKDEFGDLNKALSEMHREIKNNEESMKRLLSGIAHEIKNPLGGIEIYTGLLNEEMSKKTNHDDLREHRSYLEKITKELSHLKQVVLEYLDYARPAKSHLKPLRIESIIKDVHRILQPEMKQKNVQYALSGNGVVMGDESKLRRVFVNLLMNSLEAVSEKGTITVYIENINGTVSVRISDNGRGIPEKDFNNIFNPYFTTQDKGYGLGLAIVKNILDEMNGIIIVNSKLRKGTQITLELPGEQNETG